jgi:hypothetical protein
MDTPWKTRVVSLWYHKMARACHRWLAASTLPLQRLTNRMNSQKQQHQTTTMNPTPISTRARLRLPGTAAPANSSHDTPNVMPPAKPLRRLLTGLAAVLTMGLFALPGVSRASWNIQGTEEWTSTSGDASDGLRTVTGDFLVGVVPTPGTLNQTGGTITMNCDGIIGHVTDGTYNMSGNASLIGAGRTLIVGNRYTVPNITAIWSLTGTANASVGPLWFNWGSASDGTYHMLLAGGATVSATSLNGLAGANSYISFAPGCTATLTVAAKDLAGYTFLVNGGFIRVDGVQATMSQFQVVGNTLSLSTGAPGAPSQLAFATQPGGGAPGEVWGTQPAVLVQDASGHTVDTDLSITLAIKTGTPASGGPGTLSGTKTVSAVHGVATFSGLSIDLAGADYQLTATSGELTPADSSAFDIAVRGDSTIAGWHVIGTKTWTSTSWYDGTTTFHDTGGNGMIGVTGQLTVGFGGGNPGTLNQTGGTITCLSTSEGTIMGQVASGTYNMSGYATYIDNVGPYTIFGNFTGGGDVATWSLSDHASVTIGSQGLSIGWPGGTAGSRHLLLSGAASFTTASLTFNATGGDANYISFATGSTATLTVTAVLPENAPAYYEALVTNGSIRVDGELQTDFSAFQVVGNTLSLGSGGASPYTSWAGGNAFDSLNSEGVTYGIAWILGAATNASPSIGLLPQVTGASGSGFTVHFTRVAAPGTAKLYLEYSDSLAGWTPVEVPIPTTVPGSVVASGITFDVTTVGGLYDITAQVPPGPTGKRFARLSATE